MSSFDHVVDNIYIGSYWAIADDREKLYQSGVRSVLKLFASPIEGLERFTVLTLPFADGSDIPDGYLRRGVDFVAAQVAAGKGTLIMCAAGVSRSATFTLGYLVVQKGYDLHDAFQHLRSCRPTIWPHPVLWQSLLHFLDWPYKWDAVADWYAAVTPHYQGSC